MITDEDKNLLLQQYYDRGVLKKEIRSYEVSLWTLQDDFITVLKWSDVEQKGRIENPVMTLNIDGTQKLTFSIPMYYRVNGQLVENPNWYNTQNNNLITGLRKIKVIFNKATEFKEVFEFLIINVKESHEKDILTCEIECEGLAFQELGKIGYNISLSPENFLLEYNKWAESQTGEEPLQNVQYWCEAAGLEPYPWDGASINARKWYYDIQMNWQSFSDTPNRQSNIVYEEPYTSSWNSNLSPIAVEQYRQKCRPITIDKSNLYNITQTIAETFEIFCRYEYKYDENNHIIGKLVVFYNNFMKENQGYLSFKYPYDLSQVTRTMDSTAVTTKLFILNPDDVDITAAEVNPSKENYILNFDYLYQTKAINKEQYDRILPYQQEMRALNEEIIDLQQQIIGYETQIIDNKAKQTIAKNSIALDKEQVHQNSALLNALDAKDAEEDGLITISGANADYFILIPKEDGTQYINLANTNKGIKEDTIEIFTTISYTDNGALLANKITEYDLVHDANDYGHLIGIKLTDKHQLQNIEKIDWAKIFKDYYMPADYKGNVDLSHRVIVSGEAIRAKYDESEEEETRYGTVYTGSFTPMDEDENPISSDGKYYDIIYTPITAKGVVLGQDEINEYLDSIIAAGSTPQQWMAVDQKKDKMLLHYMEWDTSDTDHIAAGDWAENLHNLQEKWDKIRAANDWMGYDSNPNNITFDAPNQQDYPTEYPDGFNDSKYATIVQTTKVYLTYKYDPKLYYQPIIDTWKDKQAKDEIEYKNLTRLLGPESIDDEEYDMSVFDGTNITTREQAYNQGLNKKLKDAQDNLNNVKLPEKKKKIQDFEHLMGPALREGYWQPEDYKDYGDKHEYNGAISNADITADAGKDAIIAWDAKLFDTEDKLYYESGVLQDKIYYPCIDLLAVFNNNIPSDLDKYSVVWKSTNISGYEYNWNSLKDIRQCAVGSQALIKFIKYNNVIKPVLMIKGAESFTNDELTRLTSTGEARLEIFSTNVNNENQIEISHGTSQYPIGSNWITISNDTPIVYPRIKFSSMDLRANTTDLVIHYKNILLQQFNDYSILTRNTERSGKYYPEYYINIDPAIFIKYGLGQSFKINYIFSNASTSIYLDAMKVSKENAYPKASYEVSVNMLNINILNSLYTYLARIVMINDTDLKFKDVFGYISGLELDLDNYDNDKIEVKNYKTKFEDLFSTIVAQTEAMKQSGAGLTTALSGGIPLSEEGFNETLLQHTSILNAYLDSYFDSSQVVKDRLAELFTEASNILATGKKSLNSMASLTLKNASILAGFVENVAEELSTKVYRSETRPDKFDAGDIWIQVDQYDNEIGRYMAIMSSYQLSSEPKNSTRGFVRTYDGTLASIQGASLDIDAETGIINIEAQNYLNIKSGNNVYIAANEKVDIVGNKQVNIGGTEINICAIGEMEIQEDGTLKPSNTVQNAGSINLISGALANINDTNISKVLIHPDKIEMGGANIIMKGANKIQMITSRGDSNNTSAISISPDDGIFIGSGKPIRLYSGKVTVTGETIGYANSNGAVIGASVELNDQHLLMGFSNTTGATTAIEMTDNYVVIAAGNANRSLSVTGTNQGLIGAKFTKDSIGMAVTTNGITTAMLMDKNGFTVGSAGINVTTDNLRDTNNGSYTRINKDGIELGSLADLYINTDNFKLQTHSRDKGNTGYEDGDTILAIGRGLNTNDINYTTSLSDIRTMAEREANPVDVRLVINKSGAYFKGNVYASNGYFSGNVVAKSFILDDNNAYSIATTYALNISHSNKPADTNFTYTNKPTTTEIQTYANTLSAANKEKIYIWSKTTTSLGGKSTSIYSCEHVNADGTTNTVLVDYTVNSSAAVPSSPTWYTDRATAVAQIGASNQFLITRTRIFQNYAWSASYTFAKLQDDADVSPYVESIKTLYYLSTGNAPSQITGTTEITRSTNEKNKWTLVVPTYDGTSENQYVYYTCEQKKWVNHTPALEWTAPVQNYGLTVANQHATAASKAAADAATSVAPIANYGLAGTTTWNGHSYALVLGNNESDPMLIGSNGGVTIVDTNIASGQAGYGSAVVLSGGGIGMQGSTINFTTVGSNTSALTLGNTGITMGTSGNITLLSNNVILDSTATGTNSIFELKKKASDWTQANNHYDTALKYSITNGLEVYGAITATSFQLASGATGGYSENKKWLVNERSTVYNTADDHDLTWSNSMPNVSQNKGKYLHTKKTTTLGGQSTITYEVSYIAQDGSSSSATLPPWADGLTSGSYNNDTIPAVQLSSNYALVLGAGIGIFAPKLNNGSLNDTYLKITPGEIALDYDNNNYIHMSSTGIELQGKHLLINGQQEWSRNDIIVMKPNIEEDDTENPEYWKRNLGSIETYMSSYTNDFVVIRPFYNARVVTVCREQPSWACEVSNAPFDYDINSDEFGNGAGWYKYTLEISGIRAGNAAGYDNASSERFTAVVSVYNGDTLVETLTFLNWTGTPGSTLTHFELTGGGNGTMWSGSATINYDPGTGHNYCQEGYNFKISVTNVTGWVRFNDASIKLICECDAATSSVPCTVYYYPPKES